MATDIDVQPSIRLITRNLLTSATQFERKKISEELSADEIADLMALIDYAVLYDDLGFLSAGWTGSYDSEFLQALNADGALKGINPGENEIKVVADLAQKHLVAYLGAKNLKGYEELLRKGLSPYAFGYGVLDPNNATDSYDWVHEKPDGEVEIEVGKKWLDKLSRRKGVLAALKREQSVAGRGMTFLVRTFLYMAFSDHSGIVFTPDSVRANVVEQVVRDQETEIKKELAVTQVLKDVSLSYSTNMRMSQPNLPEWISPFSSHVLSLAKADRSAIVRATMELRSALQPMRNRLAELDRQLLKDGPYEEYLSALDEKAKELEQIKKDFGSKGIELTWQVCISLAGIIGTIMEAMIKPMKIPDAIEGVRAQWRKTKARRRVIELHKMKQALPGPVRFRELYSKFAAKK